jgi:hypothetical protein
LVLALFIFFLFGEVIKHLAEVLLILSLFLVIDYFFEGVEVIVLKHIELEVL